MRCPRPLAALCLPLALLAPLLLATTSAASPKVEVVAVQYPIEGNQSGAAIERKVERYIKDAKRSGADVIVFPELLTFDAWPLGDKRSDAAITRFIAADITPGYFKAFACLAKAHGVMIVGGSSPRLDGERVLNTAIVAFADGRVVHQDKIHLTYWEADNGMSGGDTVEVFDTPFGRAVVLICYDVEFPTTSSALIDAAPALWFVPSMTDTIHGLERVRWSAQARAVEHHAFVIVTGTVGTPSKDFPNVGQAAFLTPRREAFAVKVVEGAREKPGLVRATLDTGALAESRKKAKLYPAKDAAEANKHKRAPLRVVVPSAP
jgi:predicted amidohydrolase